MADLPSTRQRLLEAGAERFLSQGFEATSLEQVRQRAGVSNGSLYHHFPTRAHLARALYLDALAHYQAYVGLALAEAPAAADGVRALVARHIAWVQQQTDRARVLAGLRAATRSDGEAPDWAAVNAEAFARLRRWIADETTAGRMRAMPFELWRALVLAPVMARTEDWLRQPRVQVPLAERERLAEAAACAVAPLPTPAARRAAGPAKGRR